MKNKAVLLLVLAWGLSGCVKKEQTVVPGGNTVSPMVTESEVVVEKNEGLTSLKDILLQKKAQKCTWSYDQGGQQATGTLYVSGNKFRQEVETTVEGKRATVATASDGEWLYVWNSEVAGQGIKMQLDELAREEMDWNKQYQFNCVPTTVSEAEIGPPRGVEFVDMSALLKGSEELQKKFGGE